MKTILEFKTEDEYLEWENKEGNTIYSLQDINGNFIGDIREKHLVPFWDSCKIVSFDNPQNEDREEIVEMFKKKTCNWGVLPRHLDTVSKKLVKIEILHTDKVTTSLQKGIYYVKELECLILIYSNKRGVLKFSACNFFNDLFTTISHYTCTEGQLLNLVNIVKITPINYKKYLDIDNLVGSASYKFSTQYNLKRINKDASAVESLKKSYPYLKDENFNKDVLLVTVTVQA